ncbi:MAG TPA: hypothetical protein PLP73_00635 [Candidatus Absconditabacterales bacterium]|nr:hypothetical protein [Candidatus Absconditabacterales bacterium]
MSPILNRDNFLSHFPNHILAGGRYKLNSTGKNNTRNNISLVVAEGINTIKEKYDIFFTPNGDFKKFFGEEESNKGKSLETIKKINGNIYCFVGDIDVKVKIWEEVGLTPTIVNETKNGYHMFFMFKNPVSYEEGEKDFKETEGKLVELLGIDNKAKDIARLFRVPGFKYRSDNKGEYEIKNIEYNPDEVYTMNERSEKITTVYNNVCKDSIERNKIKKEFKGKSMGTALDAMFEKINNDISATDVLLDLYGGFDVNPDGSISEGGKKTRGYKRHKTKNYINNFSNDDPEDRPVGGPRSIAKQKFKSTDAILTYFNERWGIDIDYIRKGIGSQKDIVFEDISIKPKMTESDIEKMMDGDLSSKKEKKLFKIGNNISGIIIDKEKKEIRGYNAEASDIKFINALIEPIGKTEINNEEKYIIKITKKDGREAITLTPVVGTNTELRKFLQKYGIMIPDNNSFFIYLYTYIFNETRQYEHTNKMGMQIIGGKKVIVERAGTYVDEKNGIFVRIEDFGEDKIDIDKSVDINIKDYVEQLVGGYGGKIAYPAFLLMIMGVNSYYFRNSNKPVDLPSGFMFGLSGSGKTTFLDYLFISFGIRKDVSALSKAFIYEKNARHFLPIHFSEYRNSGHPQSQQIEGILRNLFDSTPIEKGRADQTTVKYESNGMYFLDGQTIFTDDAVQTRLLMLLANEKYQGDENKLRTLPNIYYYATNVFKDMEDFNKFIEIATKKSAWIRKNTSLKRGATRVIKTYSKLLALSERLGLEDYDKFILEALSEQDGLTAQDDIQIIYQKTFNLQVINSFDYYLYKKGIVINMVEDGAKIRTNIDDLKGFIQTVNMNFLGANSLPSLSVYVDFEYIYKNEGLHGGFLRMLSTLSIGCLEVSTEEERKTLISLREFLLKNYPEHYAVKDLNAEIAFSNNQKKGEIMSE